MKSRCTGRIQFKNILNWVDESEELRPFNAVKQRSKTGTVLITQF